MKTRIAATLIAVSLVACSGGGGGPTTPALQPQPEPQPQPQPQPQPEPQLLSVGGLYQIVYTESGTCSKGTLQQQVYQTPAVVTHTAGSKSADIKDEIVDVKVNVNSDGSFAAYLNRGLGWLQFETGVSMIGQFTQTGFVATFVSKGWNTEVSDSCTIRLDMSAQRVSGTNSGF